MRVAWRVLLSAAAAVLVAAAGFVLLALTRNVEQPEAWRHQPPPERKVSAVADYDIALHPRRARIDEPVDIRISGLPRWAPVVLQSATTDATGRRFVGWAQFVADAQGVVSPDQQAPEAGSYDGRNSMGVFWSMASDDRSRFQHDSTWRTRNYELSVTTASGYAVAVLPRTYPADALQRREIRETTVDGDLWFDPERRSQPVVVRLPGSDGRRAPLTAALVASHGFAVMDLRYHRGDGRGMPPASLIPVERVTDAITWLVANGVSHGIDASRVGVFGTSKGAELGLLAAHLDPRIDALVLWAPASHVFSGASFADLAAGSSWTWQRQAVPFAPFQNLYWSGAMAGVRLMAGKPIALGALYEGALADADDRALIPVDGVQAAVLMMAGEDDRMWPSAAMGRRIGERLRAHSKSPCVLERYFAATGHRLNYELWPRGGTPDLFVMGGERTASHAAGADAWRRLIGFFDDRLVRGNAATGCR